MPNWLETPLSGRSIQRCADTAQNSSESPLSSAWVDLPFAIASPRAGYWVLVAVDSMCHARTARNMNGPNHLGLRVIAYGHLGANRAACRGQAMVQAAFDAADLEPKRYAKR